MSPILMAPFLLFFRAFWCYVTDSSTGCGECFTILPRVTSVCASRLKGCRGVQNITCHEPQEYEPGINEWMNDGKILILHGLNIIDWI